MKILFTGASSFTGAWFIYELAKRGHQVTAVFQRPVASYTGIRGRRVDFVLEHCHAHFVCSFGDELFLKLLTKPWDIVCQHAAVVFDYRSPEFNVAKALASNTYNINKVLKTMQAHGSWHLLLTGSIFEQNEGIDGSPAVSPYGLSKGLTYEVFKYYCQLEGIHLGKFVIPNPFGSLEEDRFTTYLAKQWLAGLAAEVRYPRYIRDNIPVTLLAKSYASFAESFAKKLQSLKVNPSFCPRSQESFSFNFSKEMAKRFKQTCPLIIHEHTVFSEPATRINFDTIDCQAENWHEEEFWDELAHYYMQLIPRQTTCPI